jgi:hypothetical protein
MKLKLAWDSISIMENLTPILMYNFISTMTVADIIITIPLIVSYS